jgi:hypothetical protein
MTLLHNFPRGSDFPESFLTRKGVRLYKQADVTVFARKLRLSRDQALRLLARYEALKIKWRDHGPV